MVHSAAGGVGILTVQLAKEFGAGRVIGTASSQEKRELALSLGADVAVDGAADGYGERILEANRGRAVDIVLDAVGGRVFTAAQDVLAPFGRLIMYGGSSGEETPPIDAWALAERNVSVGGFWLRQIMGTGVERPLGELFELTAAGKLKPQVGGEYALSDAATALKDLAERRTVGKLVLVP
ncbi:quinone oxidoreductase family protein [Nonomuraea typhae]|uniref:quinone oxidoreductase family protein n=1 Tax=Nonomuraea typhae TaxID=2603600 RepID=UPI0031B63965